MADTRPQVTLPTPAAPRRGGVGYVIMLMLLLFSIVGNLILFLLVLFFAAAAVGGETQEPADSVLAQRIHTGNSETLAIVPLSGTVDESMTEQAFRYFEYVKRDRNIRAVILEVDSPGGAITASDEIHHLISDLKTSKQVVVSMRSLAASGGYYISMPAHKIYAQPTTLTGSIGVIWPAFEVTGLMQKVGVKPEIIKSNVANEYKDAGSPFKEFTEQDRAYIRNLVNNAQEKFTKVVDDGRRGKLKVPVANVAVGKIFTADEALKLGLIDEIAYLDEVCNNTAADLGISNPTIVRLGMRTGLLNALLAKSTGTPKIELKVDPKMIEELTSPRMQYKAPSLQ